MDHVIELLIIFSMKFIIQSAPIKNGFTVKFNPISTKEDLVPKTFGALFAKIPQEFKPKDEIRKDILSKAFFPYSTELGNGCTNQIAKLMFPMTYGRNANDSTAWNNMKIMNLPLIQQPYDDYKILVATAPPDVKFGGPDGKDLVVYVVFPEDGWNPSDHMNIPKVYFVNERNGKMEIEKKEPMDPLFIIDSNRTVTGLKSNAVSKFVRFKSKLLNRHFEYKLSR